MMMASVAMMPGMYCAGRGIARAVSDMCECIRVDCFGFLYVAVVSYQCKRLLA